MKIIVIVVFYSISNYPNLEEACNDTFPEPLKNLSYIFSMSSSVSSYPDISPTIESIPQYGQIAVPSFDKS